MLLCTGCCSLSTSAIGGRGVAGRRRRERERERGAQGRGKPRRCDGVEGSGRQASFVGFWWSVEGWQRRGALLALQRQLMGWPGPWHLGPRSLLPSCIPADPAFRTGSGWAPGGAGPKGLARLGLTIRGQQGESPKQGDWKPGTRHRHTGPADSGVEGPEPRKLLHAVTPLL